MRILVTGSKGMIGTALVNNLKTIRDGVNNTRPNIFIDEIYEYDIDLNNNELDYFCSKADYIFDLAGVNRPSDPKDYMNGNLGFTQELLDLLTKHNNKAPIMFSSSIQASLSGCYENSEYGRSKKACEELVFKYAEMNALRVAVYRFPNIMGHSKPNYNSAVSTFCWAIANDESYIINDRMTEIELLYIDDLIEGMFDFLEGKEKHCDYDGREILLNENGRFCYIPTVYKVRLGEIVDLLLDFKKQPSTLLMPQMKDNSFEKKLYSLYLTYLPKDRFKYELNMHTDYRGSFTELLRSDGYGQVSVNISKPGITKGQHWHNSKWEIFIVVQGHAMIKERNINTGEKVEFEVSGDKIEAVYMIPGWTHNIINLSETQELITIMICNEMFDLKHPDTFKEDV